MLLSSLLKLTTLKSCTIFIFYYFLFGHLPYIFTGILAFPFLGLDSYLVRVTVTLKWGACRRSLFDLLGTVAGYLLGVREAPNQEPVLELHSRAVPSVEVHHCVNGPDTGRNSGGRWKKCILCKINNWKDYSFTSLAKTYWISVFLVYLKFT